MLGTHSEKKKDRKDEKITLNQHYEYKIQRNERTISKPGKHRNK